MAPFFAYMLQKTHWSCFRLKKTGKKTAPYAVNQICHASNDRLAHDVEACVRHRVPLVITSLRPPRELVEAVHGYGGLLFHDVISVRHARKAAEQGDVLHVHLGGEDAAHRG